MAIVGIYFSPNGSTEAVVRKVTEALAEEQKQPARFINFTNLTERRQVREFTEEDVVILGMPVYAGRVPNKIMPDLSYLRGQNTPLFAFALYGNRSVDEGLREMVLSMERRNFIGIGGAAVPSKHAFSKVLGVGNPNKLDLARLSRYIVTRYKTWRSAPKGGHMEMDRASRLKPYYVPKKEDGTPAKFLKAKPVTDLEKCDGCGYCQRHCPMDSISLDDPSEVTGICIKCQACVNGCPKQAKKFVDEDFLSHVRMLEANFQASKTLWLAPWEENYE